MDVYIYDVTNVTWETYISGLFPSVGDGSMSCQDTVFFLMPHSLEKPT